MNYICLEEALESFRDALDGGYVIQNYETAASILNRIPIAEVPERLVAKIVFSKEQIKEAVTDQIEKMVESGRLALAFDWISVDENLPDDGELVLAIWDKSHFTEPGMSVMRFYKGKSADEVDIYDGVRFCDEWGNNKKPYAWCDPSGPMTWYGQDVSYWMPLPEPPKEEP